MENIYKIYIEECIEELIDRLENSKHMANATGDIFENGKAFAYNNVANFLIMEAQRFGIKDGLTEKIKTFEVPR
jgi:hypothetical protein